MPEIDTQNDYMVGVQGDTVRVLMPLDGRIPKARALRLAAWLVALADGEDEFPAILEAVLSI